MRAFFIALIVVFILAWSVIGPFTVASPSMEDTLLTGDTFLALKYKYGLRMPFTDTVLVPLGEPEPGDIVLFANPVDPDQTYVKRCIAVGGQTLSIDSKTLFVDGVEVPLPPDGKHADPNILEKEATGKGKRDFYDEITVPEGMVFFMGDNRDFSIDSRIFGPVPLENIRGKVGPVFWSTDPDVSWREPGKKIRWNRMFGSVR